MDEIRRGRGRDRSSSSTSCTRSSAPARAEGAIDASTMMKPALARGELQVVGATTLDEYRKYIEKDPALERRFAPVFVDEPSVEETIEMLRGLRRATRRTTRCRSRDEALVAAARLSRPLPHRAPPARQGHRPHRRGREQARHRQPEHDAGAARAEAPPRRARRWRRKRPPSARTTRPPPASRRRSLKIKAEYEAAEGAVGEGAPRQRRRHGAGHRRAGRRR